MKKELLDNMIEKIEVEVENYYLDCFIEECFESELLEEDMTTFLVAKIEKDTYELNEISVLRVPTHISWGSSKYEYIVIYEFNNHSIENMNLLKEIIEEWEYQNFRDYEEDDLDEIYEIYESEYKDNFDEDYCYNEFWEDELEEIIIDEEELCYE